MVYDWDLEKLLEWSARGRTDLLEWSGLETNSSWMEDAGLCYIRYLLLYAASSAVQMIHCTMPRIFLTVNCEDGDLSGLLFQKVLQTQRKSAGIESRYWQLSYYVYMLCYRRRRWYYRFDATSKVQSTGEPSIHTTGLHHAVLHRNTHVRYAGHTASAERRISLWDTTNSGIWGSDPA